MNAFFSLLAGLLLVGSIANANASGEVAVIKANSIVSTHQETFQAPSFDVLVKNLAYVKQVYIHMLNYDGTWIDLPLSYSRPAMSGYEVWTGTYNLPNLQYKTWDLQFDAKYVVNGNTYWDNNNGANYSLARNAGTILINSPLYNNSAVYNEYYAPSSHGTTYSGAVTVNNYAYAKDVTVVYTTDGWATIPAAHTAAVYNPFFWAGAYSSAANPNQYGFEDWSFSFPVGNAKQIQYAISYTVNGQTFWDNNFGNNYVVNILP